MKKTEKKQEIQEDIFNDVRYICGSNNLIIESLQNGLDVTQLENGDIMITEVKTIHTQYAWDKDKSRMMKISQTQ